MKKILLTVLAVTVVATFQAGAIIVTIDRVNGYSGGDGEFDVSLAGGLGTGVAGVDLYNDSFGHLGFGTFCIDRSVFINVPGQYNATVIGSGIDPNNGNQISLGTAWLFSRFATGILGGYNYAAGVNRANAAYQLQLAIWILEGQYPLASIIPGSDPFLNLAIAQFGSLVAAAADNNHTYNVGVLGLDYVDANGNSTGAHAQPMLTLLSGDSVPDGGSVLILLGMGLSGLAVFARKFRA